MRSLAQKRRKWKVKVASKRKALKEMLRLKEEIDDIDVKVSTIRALIPLGLEAVNKNLQKAVMGAYPQSLTSFTHK